MPGINFQEQFSQAVKGGEKTQTIRKRRTPPIEAGQHLTLWTGQRTKNCQPLGDATCQMVRPIKIIPERQEIWLWDDESETVDDGEIIGNFYLVKDTAAFARLDGFDTPDKFFEFFKQYPSDVLQSELVVIYWQLR
jgi:hypothetical protein